MKKSNRKRNIASLVRDNGGATALEYAIIIAGLAFVVLGSVNFIGDAVQDTFDRLTAKLTGQSMEKWEKKEDAEEKLKEK